MKISNYRPGKGWRDERARAKDLGAYPVGQVCQSVAELAQDYEALESLQGVVIAAGLQ